MSKLYIIVLIHQILNLKNSISLKPYACPLNILILLSVPLNILLNRIIVVVENIENMFMNGCGLRVIFDVMQKIW